MSIAITFTNLYLFVKIRNFDLKFRMIPMMRVIIAVTYNILYATDYKLAVNFSLNY